MVTMVTIQENMHQHEGTRDVTPHSHYPGLLTMDSNPPIERTSWSLPNL